MSQQRGRTPRCPAGYPSRPPTTALSSPQRHTFREPPNPKAGFDGIVVRFQVLECEPPSRLAYSWAAGPIIDTQVIYRLEPDGDGTRFWPAMSERSESNGGGGNCTLSPVSLTIFPKCGYNMAPGSWPEMGREDEALRELVATWHCLTPSVRATIMDLARRG
jgi:hypothetical protein